MDAPHSPQLIPAEEFAALLSNEPDRQIRLVRDLVLLPSMDKMLPLLNISVRDLWEALRCAKPRLPVYKTMEKSLHFQKDSLSAGALRKLLQSLPIMRAPTEINRQLADAGFAIPGLVAWAQVFDASIFNSTIAAKHWLSITRQVGDLNGPQLRGATGSIKRVEVYVLALMEN